MFSVISCLILLGGEIFYILLLFSIPATDIDTGMMLIFAIECWYLLKIVNGNLEFKNTLGSVGTKSRIYTGVFGISLLTLMALTSGAMRLPGIRMLSIAACIFIAFGKIMWRIEWGRRGLSKN